MPLTVFTYHRILPEPMPDAVSCDQFRRQLDELSRRFRLLTPTEAEAYINGSLPCRRPCAVLTFDDGWADNLFFATPILKERGLQAAIAFSAGFLHDRPRRRHPDPELLRLSMNACHQRAAGGDLSPFLSRDEWKTMLDSGCWQLEPHGTRHQLGAAGVSLLATPQNGESPEQFRAFLRDDLENCLEQRASLTPEPPRWFFWPWGHYSSLAEHCLADIGFKRQFSVNKGCILAGDRRRILPRVGVSARKVKFRRNCLVFSSPFLTLLHHLLSHEQQVRFPDRIEPPTTAKPQS